MKLLLTSQGTINPQVMTELMRLNGNMIIYISKFELYN